jgi:hypothetical protein
MDAAAKTGVPYQRLLNKFLTSALQSANRIAPRSLGKVAD